MGFQQLIAVDYLTIHRKKMSVSCSQTVRLRFVLKNAMLKEKEKFYGNQQITISF